MSDITFAPSPLIEALIDIQVETDSNLPLDIFAQLNSLDSERFPIPLPMVDVELRGQNDPWIDPTVLRTESGFIFYSADTLTSFQSRRKQFVFVHYAPYPRWEEFRADALRWWQHYREQVQPSRITRVAMRYTNRLMVPIPTGPLNEYVNIGPAIPNEIAARSIAAFTMQLQISLNDIDAQAVITQQLLPPEENKFPILLDFDVYRETDTVPQDDEALWNLLDQFRDRRNDLYHSSLTDKMRALIAKG